MKKGVRYEYCNGRAGGNIKQPHGESLAAGKNDKNDKKKER